MTSNAFKFRAFVGVVVLAKLAMVLLVIPNLAIVSQGNYNINKLPDSYPKIAKNLIQGHGYRLLPDTTETMIRPPVNTFLLAAVFSVFGESLVAVQVINVLLTVAGGLLLMKLVRRRTRDPVMAWLAAAMFVFHPGIMLAETRGGVEVPITFLMILFVYLLDRAFKSKRARDFLLAGLALGIAGLAKSTPVAIAPFLLVYAFFRYSDQRVSMCRNVLILWMGLGLMLTPWVVRNYLVSGHFVPSMTIKGAAAYQGLYLSRHGQGEGEFHEALDLASREQKAMAGQMGFSIWEGDMLPIFYSAEDEVEFDARLFQHVMDEYKQAPGLFVENVAQNTWRFWLQGRTSASTVMNAVITVPLLVLAGVGVVVGFRRRFDFELILLFVAVYYLAHLPLIAFAKYHVPIIPFLVIFASLAVAGPVESLLARRKAGLHSIGHV